MLSSKDEILNFFYNEKEFIACLEYTARKTGFSAELIEKDFLCSLLLSYVYESADMPLCFKGGTVLAKVYAGFYRLSEDLDFSLSVPVAASRKERSQTVRTFKSFVKSIPKELAIFYLSKELTGSNVSRQYNAEFEYDSKVSPGKGTILFEISVREPHLESYESHNAHALLEDDLSGEKIIAPFKIKTLSKDEVYAEKMRAALTRNPPAIRDFFDILYASKNNVVDFMSDKFVKLLKRKLSLPEVTGIDLSDMKKRELETQINAELVPTLSTKEEVHFNLENVFAYLSQYLKEVDVASLQEALV